LNRLSTREGRWIRLRMMLIGGALAFGAGLVVAAGYGVMIKDGREWREMAENQRQRRLRLSPKRGGLYDRNGSPLAVSVDVPSVSLDAVEILRGVPPERIPVVARQLAERIGQALELDPAPIERKILARRRFAWIKRRITLEEADRLRELTNPEGEARLQGLVVEAEGRRYYPRRELGGPLLGFVAPDGNGKDGVELRLDEELRGHSELLKGLRDRSGRLLFMDGIEDEQTLAGNDIELSIDQGIQNIAERELGQVAQTFEAISGSAIVLRPETGEILALASWPGYNPNDYRYSRPETRRVRPLTDRFEPGSSMKIFTVAAGLEAGVVRSNEQLYCEKGSFKIDDVTIRDTHPAAWLTPSGVLAVSSNICAAKIGLKLGSAGLYEALRRFGFGQETGIPVPGETAGVLLPRNRPWVPVETASASFGHGLSVTNLQLALATAAIANGGKLLEPILVRRVLSPSGELIREAAPRVRRQAVSAAVARTVAEMLIGVTEGRGTGVEAAVDGFVVAGKTATAQKTDAKTGRYSQENYVASFVGFVPARKPEIVIAVTLDDPAVEHSGGGAAAPVFRRIARATLNYMGVTPQGSKPIDMSELVGASDAARATEEVLRRGDFQRPPVQEIRERGKLEPGSVRVPDLTGFPMREAVRRSVELGVKPQVTGTGLLARQSPPPGGVLKKGEALVLVFEPAT
jgi:cell division protein FtsI (penicillin-binding protein 3)